MGFAEDIGRSDTLRAVTNDITGLAMDMRRGEEQKIDRESLQRIRNLEIQEKEMDIADKQRKNTLVPLSQFRKGMYPTTAAYLYRGLTAFGGVEMKEGVPYARQGNIEEFQKTLEKPEEIKKINTFNLRDIHKNLEENCFKIYGFD